MNFNEIFKKFNGSFGFECEELEFVISFIYPDTTNIGKNEITNNDVVKAHIFFDELSREYPNVKITMDVNTEYITINLWKED